VYIGLTSYQWFALFASLAGQIAGATGSTLLTSTTATSTVAATQVTLIMSAARFGMELLLACRFSSSLSSLLSFYLRAHAARAAHGLESCQAARRTQAVMPRPLTLFRLKTIKKLSLQVTKVVMYTSRSRRDVQCTKFSVLQCCACLYFSSVALYCTSSYCHSQSSNMLT